MATIGAGKTGREEGSRLQLSGVAGQVWQGRWEPRWERRDLEKKRWVLPGRVSGFGGCLPGACAVVGWMVGGGAVGFLQVPEPLFRKFWVENACQSWSEARGYLSHLPSPSAQPVARPLSGSLSLSRPLWRRSLAADGHCGAVREQHGGHKVSSVPLAS